jgi:endo-1,3(4)-beta-glucanase
VNVNLVVNENQRLTANLVQGMGFVTARYYNLTPILSSGVFFRSVTSEYALRGGLQKWRITLEDGKIWLLYVCPAQGSSYLNFTSSGNGVLNSNSFFTGFIQIAKLSDPGQEGIIDAAAGAFPVTTTLSAGVSGSTGTYSFSHSRYGVNNAGALLMYALPHHVSSFDDSTGSKKVNLFLNTPTKGMMQGVLADNWTLIESGLPIDITWLPQNGANINGTVVDQVRAAASTEAQQDMNAQSNLDSMYFSGKALAKFAQIVLALAVVVKDQDQARSALVRLQQAISRFTTNSQMNPLVYDLTWKGIVSSAMYKTGDLNQDFGNGAYSE